MKKRIVRKRKGPAGKEPRDTAHPPLPKRAPIDPVKIAEWLEAWDEKKAHLPPGMGSLTYFQLKSASMDADLLWWTGSDLALLLEKLRRVKGPGNLVVHAEGGAFIFPLNAGDLLEARVECEGEFTELVAMYMCKMTH